MVSAAPQQIRIVHSSPGRVRLKISPAEALDGPVLIDAVRRLREYSGISEIRLNSAAASLVLRYDPHRLVESDVLGLLRGAGLTIRPAASPVPAPFSTAVSQVRGSKRPRDRFGSPRAGFSPDPRAVLPALLAVLMVREIARGQVGFLPIAALAWYGWRVWSRVRPTL